MSPTQHHTHALTLYLTSTVIWHSASDTNVTPLTLHEPTKTTISSSNGYSLQQDYRPKIKETAKQKIKRIATERMLASWHLYNQKTITIKQLKQLCKPRHQLNFIGVRR